MRPRVGSSVMIVMFVPGAVLRVLGYVTATGWLATEFAGWKATMKALTIVGTGGFASGRRSTGTCTPTSGNGLGREPSGSVNVVPPYTVSERPGMVLKE